MARASVWFTNNDVRVRVAGIRSTTMSTGSYLNSSTGVRASIWKATSTGSTTNRVINNVVLSYVAASNGTYDYIAQSTAVSALTPGLVGMAVITLNHAGLNGEWRPTFRVEYRNST